jgi:hypothetical protein
MTRKPARPPAPAKAAKGKHVRPPVTPSVAAIPEAAAAEPERIVQRPDGYHWIAPDGRQEFGPFETLEEARADMLDAVDDNALQPGEALPEAESEIGIADWIDPETGEPAEGQSPPHLDQE